MKVFYMIQTEWENDYIKYDIFGNINNIEFIDYTASDASHFEYIKNYPNVENNCMIVVNSNNYGKDVFSLVEDMIKTIKPLVIVWCSDQIGDREDFLTLSQYTKLMLRQHIYKKYLFTNTPNLYQIPLGYMKNMLQQRSSLDITVKPINERKYTWASIIQFKFDRQEMLNKFQNAFSNHYCNTSGRISANIMGQIYNDAIFVPNGRGDFRLDCFRLYEACLLGAIPVIAGDQDEINETFFYNNNKPPFLYCNDWDDAIVKCSELLTQPEKLVNMQKSLLEWWKNEIITIQKKIAHCI